MIATKRKENDKKKATEIWVGGRFELQKAREFLPSPFWLLFFRSLFLFARARSHARTPVLSLPPPSFPSLPRNAVVAAVADLLVLGDAGCNGLFFVHLVCCWEYSGSCVLVGWLVSWLSGLIWFSTGLRAFVFFLGGGGGVDLC
jgi:hypothetical protein